MTAPVFAPILLLLNRSGRAPRPEPPSAFRGSGHTLGSDDVPSSLVPDPNARGALSIFSDVYLTKISKVRRLQSVISLSGAMASQSKMASLCVTTIRTMNKSYLRSNPGNFIQHIMCDPNNDPSPGHAETRLPRCLTSE
jgi:hypothetical protein